MLGDTGGVTPAPGAASWPPDPPTLTEIAPVLPGDTAPAPGGAWRANFSGLEIPVTGGKERGEGEGRKVPCGRAE